MFFTGVLKGYIFLKEKSKTKRNNKADYSRKQIIYFKDMNTDIENTEINDGSESSTKSIFIYFYTQIFFGYGEHEQKDQ